MDPSTDGETREALERFARVSTEEKVEVLGRGRLIQTLEDLEGLPGGDVARLRPIIETQTVGGCGGGSGQ